MGQKYSQLISFPTFNLNHTMLKKHGAGGGLAKNAKTWVAS